MRLIYGWLYFDDIELDKFLRLAVTLRSGICNKSNSSLAIHLQLSCDRTIYSTTHTTVWYERSAAAPAYSSVGGFTTLIVRRQKNFPTSQTHLEIFNDRRLTLLNRSSLWRSWRIRANNTLQVGCPMENYYSFIILPFYLSLSVSGTRDL